MAEGRGQGGERSALSVMAEEERERRSDNGLIVASEREGRKDGPTRMQAAEDEKGRREERGEDDMKRIDAAQVAKQSLRHSPNM